VTKSIDEVMRNLLLPQYSGIRDVFDTVLAMRSRRSQPSCSLLNLLATKQHILELLNEDCIIYVREIGSTDARKKCESDLLGKAKRPEAEFNGACDDFWSEMAAIRVLAEAGYHGFHAIRKQKRAGTTSDYEAHLGNRSAHIEVKNMRAGKTVLDVFDREIRRLYASEPDKYAFNIQVDYPYDNDPTGEQGRTIRSYVASLRRRQPPFKDQLDLGEAVARINVIQGSGSALMIRNIGPDPPEPLSKAKFLAKIRDKAEEARAQMKDKQRLRVLVINISTRPRAKSPWLSSPTQRL
jgi:hypothetical protein